MSYITLKFLPDRLSEVIQRRKMIDLLSGISRELSSLKYIINDPEITINDEYAKKVTYIYLNLYCDFPSSIIFMYKF